MDALRDCAPELALSQQSWLCRPAQAVVTQPYGTRVVLQTTNGIPQGDPLSSLAFACLLRRATKDFLHQWQRGPTQQAASAAHALSTNQTAGAVAANDGPAMPGQAANAAGSGVESTSAVPYGDVDESAYMRLTACP
eukprot:5656751-Amphidinium_carterae.1